MAYVGECPAVSRFHPIPFYAAKISLKQNGTLHESCPLDRILLCEDSRRRTGLESIPKLCNTACDNKESAGLSKQGHILPFGM